MHTRSPFTGPLWFAALSLSAAAAGAVPSTDPVPGAVDPWPGESPFESGPSAAALAVGLTLASDGATGRWSGWRPDGTAPIGVMGDHLHHAGGWMVSLRAMRMHMEGMRDGTQQLSSADVFAQGFGVSPLQMNMDMLMLGAMYAPTDDLTLMAMVPWVKNEMDLVTGGGVEFTTASSGIGDVRLSGLLGLFDADGQRLHLNLGLSIPTGSIDERDDTPAMADAKLPYPMQIGTGTFDLLPGLTYLGQRGDWSYGAQSTWRFHLGRNGEGYRHGNRIEATAWGARRFGALSASVRVAASAWDNFSGQDDDLNPNVVPTAAIDLRGGERLDAFVGVNYLAGEGRFAGHRLALEVGAPVHQDLDGPQLETDWIATLGWQLSF